MSDLTKTLHTLWGSDETIIVNTKDFLESAILLAEALDEDAFCEEFVDEAVPTSMYDL